MGEATRKKLSQLDFGGAIKNSHQMQADALRVIDVDNIVNDFFTRADVIYNSSNSATAADFWFDQGFHITEMCITTNAAFLNNRYILVDDAIDENNYYIWYNYDGTGTDPMISGRTAIEVPLAIGDTTAVVTMATRLLFNASAASEYITLEQIGTNKLKFTNKKEGFSSGVRDGTTVFNYEILNKGESILIDSIELPFDNNVRYVYNEFEKTFEIFPEITVTVSEANNSFIANINVPAAGVENNFVLPDGTKRFTIKVRQNDTDMDFSYVSSGNTLLVRKGVSYTEQTLNTTNVTLYFTLTNANKDVEIIYWT